MCNRCLFVVMFLIAASTTGAAEPGPWPQFRGPSGSGVADDEQPPIELGPETVFWKVPVPSGASSPIVVGDKLVITAFDDGKLYTIACNRADGSEAWRAHAPAEEIEPFHRTEGSPAASTAATDGERIVSYFGSCGIFCYDLAGNELWNYKLPAAATVSYFGTGTSPIIVDDLVVLVREQIKDSKVIVLEAATGEPVWEKPRQSTSSFSTPAAWTTPEGTQIAAPGFGKMIGYDLRTGDEKWFVEGMPSVSCTTPVTAGGNLYFAGWAPNETGGPTYNDTLKESDSNGDGALSRDEIATTAMKDFFDGMDLNKDGSYTRDESEELVKFMAATVSSAFALKPGGSGDVTKSHIVWRQTRGLPYVSSAIVYRGQFIMVKDGGIVTAYDAKTGDELYTKRLAEAGNFYASPVAANGHVYFVSLVDGAITVVKVDANEPEAVATSAPLDERVAATPAIADDTLYVRTAGHLYAFSNQE